MERIVDQTIPNVVINNPHVDWNPNTNDVRAAAVSDVDEPTPANLVVSNAPEPNTRYEILLGTYQAVRQVDPYSPTAPTHIDRSFSEGREIPEERVVAMFEAVTLLGVYSHMIHSFLYLPNYPIGGMIAHQIEEQIAKSGDLGAEFERMCLAGNIAPDLWMKNATGKAVGPDALLNATASALEIVASK